MSKQSTWRITELEGNQSIHDFNIINTSFFEHKVYVPEAVVIETLRQIDEIEAIRDNEREDLQSYLSYHFDLDETYFENESLTDFADYEQIQEFVLNGHLYLIEDKRFATLDDFKCWDQVWVRLNGMVVEIYPFGTEVEVAELDSFGNPISFSSLDQAHQYVWSSSSPQQNRIHQLF